MKYYININQAQAAKICPDLDFNDLAIYDFIKSFATSGNCATIYDGDKVYYWVSHTVIINELPLLHIKSKTGIIARINKLVDAGILEKYSKCSDLGKSYYTFGSAAAMLETSTPPTQKNTPLQKNIGDSTKICRGGLQNFVGNNIYNTINTINNKDNESENEFSQSFTSSNQNENFGFYGNPTFDREENQSTLNAETPDPQCSAAPPTPDAATQRETDAETLREFWNATLVSEGFPTVKKLNAQRITKAAQVVREMVKEGVTADQLFDKIKNSDFLKSGSKSWFNFDWLIQKRARQFDANWKIIMSGKYDNAPAIQKKKETPAHLQIDPEFAIKFLNNDF